jgi:hypothetical protein
MADIIDRTFDLLLMLFRRVPIPYAVIGRFAAGVWGVERATLDIDVLVGGRRQQFDALIALAEKHRLQPPGSNGFCGHNRSPPIEEAIKKFCKQLG